MKAADQFQDTSIQNHGVTNSIWGSWSIHWMCCFLTPNFPCLWTVKYHFLSMFCNRAKDEKSMPISSYFNSKRWSQTQDVRILVHSLNVLCPNTQLPLSVNCKLQCSLSCIVSMILSERFMYEPKSLGGSRHWASKWRMKTEQIQVLVNMLHLLFSNTSLPLTSSPVHCKLFSLHSACLHIDEVRPSE